MIFGVFVSISKNKTMTRQHKTLRSGPSCQGIIFRKYSNVGCDSDVALTEAAIDSFYDRLAKVQKGEALSRVVLLVSVPNN